MKLQKTSAPLFLLALVFALLLAACGGGEEASGPESVAIEVVQNDIYYGDTPNNAENPPVWTVPAGSQVTVNLTNNGTLQHNFAIVEAGETVPETFNAESDAGILYDETGLVDAGATFNDVFTAPSEPGTYTVICTVAGHYPGMQGRLEVTGE